MMRMRPERRFAWRVVVSAAALVVAGCQHSERSAGPDPAVLEAAWAGIVELHTTDVIVGEGAEVGAGSRVQVHYEGWLYDPTAPGNRGSRFDSSRERGRPFAFRVGSGMVIRGWDQGVMGMRPGGRRELVIPAALGYGARGAGGGVIPPGAALVFDVELLAVE